MSIHIEITRRAAEDRLFRVKPQISGSPEPRVIYLTAELQAQIFGDDDAPRDPRMALLHADLDRFISGMEIVVGSRRHKTAYMKQLEPERDEVWEVRSRDPNPQYRIFGSFADTNLFIGTHMMERSWLGLFQSFMWRRSMRRSKAIWRSLFITWPPKQGNDIHDYISENVLDLRRAE